VLTNTQTAVTIVTCDWVLHFVKMRKSFVRRGRSMHTTQCENWWLRTAVPFQETCVK